MAKKSGVDAYIHMKYKQNIDIINKTSPTTVGGTTYTPEDLFSRQVKAKVAGGETLGDAVKDVVGSRTYTYDKALGEARWHHEQFRQDISGRVQRKLNRRSVSTKFGNMSFVDSYSATSAKMVTINGVNYGIRKTYSSNGDLIHEAFDDNDSQSKKVFILERGGKYEIL